MGADLLKAFTLPVWGALLLICGLACCAGLYWLLDILWKGVMGWVR